DFDMTDRIEAQIERFAPGFRDLILARVSRTARAQEAYDPTCVGGDIGCGAQTVWQTFARPVLRWDPYCTPLSDTYLCSAATIPGPGVHGLCGQLAALSCLRHTFGVSEPPSLN
ncbi:MAG: dehydrogenase, partial [Candidatus Dormibacteria bacterium]